MRLIQFVDAKNTRRVGAIDDMKDSAAHVVEGVLSVRDVAMEAAASGRSLVDLVGERLGAPLDLDAIVKDTRLLSPIDHPEPARCWITGTGLTHLGSAKARSEMHKNAPVAQEKPAAEITDSMRMFEWGVKGGKPPTGKAGVQPEWFYKGNGNCVVAPGKPLVSPGFAEDAGDEAEVAGVYVIGQDRMPRRVGFVLGNELSDHIMERRNYLYLAHSKIRPCAVGPELLVGDLPRDVQGRIRVLRGAEVVFESEFRSGEDNMAHTLANLEHHHFKYDLFRNPGDVHIHFFGADVLSFAGGFRIQAGDAVEVSATGFGRPLVNTVVHDENDPFVAVRAL